jgi:hypothetical protein
LFQAEATVKKGAGAFNALFQPLFRDERRNHAMGLPFRDPFGLVATDPIFDESAKNPSSK